MWKKHREGYFLQAIFKQLKKLFKKYIVFFFKQLFDYLYLV